MQNKLAVIIGGGTVFHVRPHLALSAPAYGETANKIYNLIGPNSTELHRFQSKLDTRLHLTRMAGGSKDLETSEDVARLLQTYMDNPLTKIIFMNAAMVDFEGYITEPVLLQSTLPEDNIYYRGNDKLLKSGKDQPRLSSNKTYDLRLVSAPKIIANIRKTRKDIFLVGFKTTAGATPDEQYLAGLKLCKDASCNLVLANDIKTRFNMIITPEEARYHETTDRDAVLEGLVEMAYLRSHLTFTRSTVVAGDSVAWDSELIPSSLRTVVNHCIQNKAYKPFGGSTVGHFACKLDDTTFLTSKRKTDFNKLPENGLVKIVTDSPDSVIAYGSKPSVGGQSQRIVFHDHKEYDCIVHFHSPIRTTSTVPIVSQREFECGSHECGKNTSNGLKQFGNLSAVYLDQHGPNVVFHHSIDPAEVIKFIEENFDLSQKTGGLV